MWQKDKFWRCSEDCLECFLSHLTATNTKSSSKVILKIQQMRKNVKNSGCFQNNLCTLFMGLVELKTILDIDDDNNERVFKECNQTNRVLSI